MSERNYKPHRTLIPILMALMTGCSESGRGITPEPLSGRDVGSAEEIPDRPRPDVTMMEHDFGTVLARGQTLRHDFLLSNPTTRAMRLVKAMSFAPCCSEIGPLPEAIPPGGEAKVQVS